MSRHETRADRFPSSDNQGSGSTAGFGCRSGGCVLPEHFGWRASSIYIELTH